MGDIGMDTCRRLLVILGLSLILGSPSFGQFDPTRILGTTDNDIPVPVAAHTPGRVDPEATQVVAAHFGTVGAVPWVGMQAQGTLAYSGVEGSQQNAELLIRGQDMFRLKVSGTNGVETTIIRGRHGTSVSADGSIHGISSSTAQLGLVQFPMVRSESISSPTLSLIDHGVLSIGGNALQRISLEFPPRNSNSSLQTAKNDPPQVIDFYFDVNSHLLVKTASVIRLEGQGTQNFIRVITYSDYRQADNVLIPFRMEESLNGEPQWVLQFVQVQLTPNLSPSDFDF